MLQQETGLLLRGLIFCDWNQPIMYALCYEWACREVQFRTSLRGRTVWVPDVEMVVSRREVTSRDAFK